MQSKQRKEQMKMKTNNLIRTAVVLSVGSVIVWLALVTMPETNNCTPRLIAKYTNVMISHQECEAMSRCVIEPKDIRDFHTAQINFHQCVSQVVGESKE